MNKNLDIVWTNQFKKDYKLAMKRHLDIDLLDDIIRKLASGEQLPDKNKDHNISILRCLIRLRPMLQMLRSFLHFS